MTVQILRWQFTVADFARMIEAGIFAEDDRVELIDGEVRAMSPIGPRHGAIVKRLNALMSRQIADRAILSVQDSIQLTDYTEPQPDLAVLRLREDFYVQAHAVPAAASCSAAGRSTSPRCRPDTHITYVFVREEVYAKLQALLDEEEDNQFLRDMYLHVLAVFERGMG